VCAAWIGQASVAVAAEASIPEPPPDPGPPRGSGGIGGHFLWAFGKVMPGVTVRGGKGWIWGELEGAFIWITEDDPHSDRSFLGNQFGVFAMARPLHLDRLRLAAGLGGDFYPLWNIHSDEWKMALAVRLRADARIASNLWAFGTARSYLLSSDGLELGVARDESKGLPVLFGTGLEWSFE
jgi:hypothetical protein